MLGTATGGKEQLATACGRNVTLHNLSTGELVRVFTGNVVSVFEPCSW